MGQVITKSGISNLDFEALKDDSRFSSFDKPLKFWSNEQFLFVLIAKIFFMKIPFFKNRNKDSWILIKSILITFISIPIFIFGTFFLIKVGVSLLNGDWLQLKENFSHVFQISLSYLASETNEKKVTLLALSAASLVYFNLRSRFSGQWKYCADLYNKISYEKLSYCDPRDILYQRVTLAIDLIQLDLYAHKSFRSVFNIALEKAITYCYSRSENELNKIKKDVSDECNFWLITRPCSNLKDEILRFKSGKASTGQAHIYLSRLQNDLDNLMTLDYTPPEIPYDSK